ncbi:MAG: sulfite exporter TauE/SafE family protein [Gammaproteobacteria bacterium]
MEYSLLFAFTVGFFSTLHCLGMCGGIIGALSFSLPEQVRQNRWRFIPYLLAYNTGRILSYAAAGSLIGYLGMTVFTNISPKYGHALLQWTAALFMIAIGLYLAGWFPRFALVENLGKPLWRKLEPLGQRLLPVKSPTQALLFGLVWGWLPCGLVYAAIVYAAASGGAVNGALFMAFFGLGTLPTVLSAGILAHWVARLSRMPQVKRGAGFFIIILAVLTLVASTSTDHAHFFHYFHVH